MSERLRGDAELGQQRLEARVVAVVEDDEAGVDGERAARRSRPRSCSCARPRRRRPRTRSPRARGAAGARRRGRSRRRRRRRSGSWAALWSSTAIELPFGWPSGSDHMARRPAVTAAATTTQPMIEPVRHATSAAGGDADRVLADGELLAVGQRRGHHERGQQRRGEQADHAEEARRQLAAAEHDRAGGLDRGGDEREARDQRRRWCSCARLLGLGPRALGEPEQRADARGQHRDAGGRERDERERDQRADRGRPAGTAVARLADQQRRRRTPGRSRRARACPCRRARRRRARPRPCRSTR